MWNTRETGSRDSDVVAIRRLAESVVGLGQCRNLAAQPVRHHRDLGPHQRDGPGDGGAHVGDALGLGGILPTDL